jgi:two-component system chemotaxis response regulator CheB
MRRLLSSSLEKVGHDVVGAGTNGDEALALCERLRPDAMTLDLAMPGKDGMAVLRTLRESSSRMFSFGAAGAGKLDVGARNDQATREALAAARIPVIAEATGGSTGRTVRVAVATPRVVVKEAGAGERELFAAGSTGGWAAR